MKYEIKYKVNGKTTGTITVESDSASTVLLSTLQELREQYPGEKVSCSHPKPVSDLTRAQRFAIAVSKLGLSVSQTADRLGVPPVTVRRYLAQNDKDCGNIANTEQRTPAEPVVRFVEQWLD